MDGDSGPFQPSAASDPLANAEAVQVSSGVDLESDGKTQEHQRHQTFRNHANKLSISLLWIVGALLGIALVIYAWHLLAPPRLHWMLPTALDRVGSLLGTAILSSALTQYVSKRME